MELEAERKCAFLSSGSRLPTNHIQLIISTSYTVTTVTTCGSCLPVRVEAPFRLLRKLPSCQDGSMLPTKKIQVKKIQLTHMQWRNTQNHHYSESELFLLL